MGIPTTMTAVLAHSSAADSLVVGTRPVPTPAADEVLLSVSAAAITSGELDWPETHPFVPAHDVSGTVVSVGGDVTEFKFGDHVIALVAFDRDGALSEYAAVKAADLAMAPSTIDPVRAASLPLGALTAWQALVDHAGLTSGQHVLVHGGSGGVGAYAVQLAAHLGARVTATARADDAELVASYGADAVIDYATAFEEQVADVDIVIDTAGRDVVDRSWKVLRKGGILVSIFDEVTPPTDAVRGKYFVVEPNGPQLAELSRLVDAGALRPVIGRIVPFADAATVFSTEKDGHHPGKTVVQVLTFSSHTAAVRILTSRSMRFSCRCRPLTASSSRLFGGAFVTSWSSIRRVAWAISSIACSNAGVFAREGWVEPLTLRTNCRAASRTSSSVVAGSKL